MKVGCGVEALTICLYYVECSEICGIVSEDTQILGPLGVFELCQWVPHVICNNKEMLN